MHFEQNHETVITIPGNESICHQMIWYGDPLMFDIHHNLQEIL